MGTARLVEVRRSCIGGHCPNHDAIVFVHGIFGDDNTFGQWPEQMPEEVNGHRIDVYRLRYQTALFAWLERDVPNLDVVVEKVFDELLPLIQPAGGRRYNSVNFIAHSLGGNVVGAYMHTVKSLLGHEIRARHGFVITLGTPVLGAQIADVAKLLKSVLPTRNDKLLESLKRDNAFLRMMRYWRILENSKAANFGCPSVNLYVGIESKPSWRFVTVVPNESALGMDQIAEQIKEFPGFTHSDLANSPSEKPDVRDWVQRILNHEIALAGRSQDLESKLCLRVR